MQNKLLKTTGEKKKKNDLIQDQYVFCFLKEFQVPDLSLSISLRGACHKTFCIHVTLQLMSFITFITKIIFTAFIFQPATVESCTLRPSGCKGLFPFASTCYAEDFEPVQRQPFIISPPCSHNMIKAIRVL